MTQIDETAMKNLRAKITSINFCMLTTITEKNTLASRPMTEQALDDDGTLWFFSTDHSELARDLELHPNVNVSFAEPSKNSYISISGEATLVRDREKAEHLWNSMVAVWYPQGLDDPHLRLVRVKIHCAEYWDSSSKKMLHLFSVAKSVFTKELPRDEGTHEKLEF